jgi:hypothetical protein
VLASGGVDLSTLEAVVIVLGFFIGTGGLVALVKWLRASGARDNRIDDTANAVLGREDDPKDNGLVGAVAEIRREIKPGTVDLGKAVEDIAGKLETLNNNFQRFVGEIKERDKGWERRFSRVEEHCPLLNPPKTGVPV